MRNWFRSRSVKPQRPPVRFKSPFHKLTLDYLEDRVVPAQQYLNLGNLLTFYGDFTGPTGSGGATIYTGASATSTDDAIQIGPYVANTADFTPTLQVEDGTVVFDTNPDTNSNLDFTITGDVVSVLSNPYIPQNTTLATVSSKTVAAGDIVGGSFNLATPYNYPSTTGLNPGDVIPGTFFVTINSIGIATSPNFGGAAIAIEGQVAINIPGGNKPIFQPPTGTPPADQITIGTNAGDVLYLTDASPYGFDISGVSIAITDTFTYNGLTIAANGLTFDIQPGDDTFEIYGGVTVSADAAQGSDFSFSAAADFGTVSDPGLQFNWSTDEIENFDLGISGGFKLGGLQVQANDLDVAYDSDTDVLAISGGISLALDGYTFSAGLTGPGNTPGLTIDRTTGQVDFDGLQIAISDFNLGVFTINSASLTFDDSSGTLDLAGALALSFPGGWGAGGSFEFSYSAAGGFELEEIGAYLSSAEGIPVGDTDIFITYLSGELDGLGTQNWSVSGTIGVAFGQTVTIQSTEVRIVQAVGGFTLDKDKLVLDASVAFAGWTTTANPTQLNSVLGILDGTVTLDWGDDTYSASVNGSFLDGLFTLEGEFKYAPGSVYLQTTAALNVPDAIPIIGGDQIASANFVFEYDYTVGTGVVNTALFAAWLHIPIIGNIGIEYDIQTKDVSLISGSAIAAIEAAAPPPVVTYNAYAQNFVIPAGSDPNANPGAAAETFNFIVQWLVNGGGSHYTVLTMPDGTTITNTLGQLSATSDNEIQLFRNIPSPGNPPGQLIAGIQANNAPNPLPAGTYTFTLYTTDDLDPNAIVWTGLAGYGVPNSTDALSYTQSGSVLTFTQNVAVNTAFLGQATADLYMDTGTSHTGVKIATTTDFQVSDEFYTISFSVDLADLDPAAGTYYFYAVIDDGFDAPNATNYATTPFIAQPQLTGTLTETADGRNNLMTGWTAYIDQNGNGQFDTGEPTAITNSSGTYAFYSDTVSGLDFQSGQSYAVGFVLPAAGYQLPTNTPATTTFTYNGGTSTVDFQVWQEIAITGVVFNDANGNGVQDAGEPGVAGVTVYLDLNNNGVLDSGEPTTSSLNSGTYEFVGLAASTTYHVRYVLPDDYLASGSRTSWSEAIGTDPYYVSAGNNFAIVAEATISGTVTGNQIFGGQLGTAAPLSGWTIQLLDSTGTVVATTTSDVNGNYEFTGLVPGDYTVQEVVPAGWQQTGPYDTNPGFTGSFTALSNATEVLVTVADFNNDGKLDYAAYLNGTQNIYYYYGNGDGTFGSAQTYSEGMTPSAIDMQTGDFNGDGFADLLVLGTDYWVRAVWGSATGFTSYEVLYSPTGDNFVVYGMAVDNLPGTWDGDGIDDFAVYGQQTLSVSGPVPTSVYYYFVDVCSSSNNFAPIRLIAATQNHLVNTGALSPLSDHALAIGDLNNDGNLDLFINFQSVVAPNYVAFIAYGHGDGTFGQNVSGTTLPDLHFEMPANGGPVALGDVNGDGILDAVTSNVNSTGITSAIYVLQQTSVGTWYGLDGNFVSPSTPGLQVNPSNIAGAFFVPQIAIADIDGDGKPDITLATSNPAIQTLTYFNQGTTNGIAQFINTGSGAYFAFNDQEIGEPNSMALGDFNNDGQVDLALGTSGVWILLNTSETVANPTITAQTNGNYTVNFTNLQFGQAQVGGAVYGDADGDGRKDAAEGGLGGVTVYLDLNNNGVLDADEPFRITNADGYYAFAGLAPGLTARVRLHTGGLSPHQAPVQEQGHQVVLGQTTGTFDLGVRQRLLHPIADTTGTAGQLLSLTPALIDGVTPRGANQPGRLVFTLDPGAPAGLTIHPATGVLAWVPGVDQAPGDYLVTVRVHDVYAPLRTDTQTFTVSVVAPPVVPPAPPVPPVVPPPPPVGQFAVGTGAGGESAVRVYSGDGTAVSTITPFGAGFTGGVRVATGDFTGDGVDDTAMAAGPGGGPRVQVIDGATGAVLFDAFVFEATFTGGVFVAAGDFDGDGKADLVVTPDIGGGPRVRVFRGGDFAVIADFFGIEDPAFRGGARAAVGDINGDGVNDLIVSAGSGGGPRVAVWDGRSLVDGAFTAKLFGDFFAFDSSLTGGAYVAAGDLNGDGFDDLIAGPGPGGGPRVLAISGRSLVGGARDDLANFFVGDPGDRTGVRVAVEDLDGDDRADLVVGSGTGGRVTGYLGKLIQPGGLPPAAFDFDAFPGMTDGVFVG